MRGSMAHGLSEMVETTVSRGEARFFLFELAWTSTRRIMGAMCDGPKDGIVCYEAFLADM